jgi:hypothetical protein
VGRLTLLTINVQVFVSLDNSSSKAFPCDIGIVIDGEL